MSQPKTQDLQAVANSATKNLASFIGGVEPVSSTKHMQDIYNGLGKLFDAFTQGALTQQGANSEYLLRTVYKSLDERFLDIVQDTQTVDKITEAIKEKQANVTPENVDSALVSQTTKQVVLKTLTPDNCDIMQVVLDFMDELQTSILQVRLNLSREYERRKIEWAKSKEGQQQDIDNLNKTLTEQGQDTVDALGRMSDEDEKWKLERLNQIESMLKVLDGIDGSDGNTSSELNSFNKAVLQDKSLQELAKENAKKIDLQKLVSEIQGSTPVLQKQSLNSPGQAKQGGFEKGYSPDQTKEQAQFEKEIQKEPNIEQQKKDQKQPKEEDQKEEQKDQKEQRQSEDEINRLSQDISSESNGISKTKLPKLQQTPQSKIDVSPIKRAADGMCTCPICGHRHPLGQPHGAIPGQQGSSQLPQPAQPNGQQQQSITQEGVVSALGKIHQNISRQINSKKFRNSFSPNYGAIQHGIQKQMSKLNKDEEIIQEDLQQTKKRIFWLRTKRKARGILGMILGGIGKLALFTVGALLLIGLVRFAVSKWAETYMPKPDGSKMTIFGVEIPGWDKMKAIGLGIYNFFTIGVKNQYTRLKHFIGRIKESMFGKKGAFRDATETKNTLRKIAIAYLIGVSKKAAGKIFGAVAAVLSFFFPAAGPVLRIITKWFPLIYSFVTTQIMLMWSNHKADAERQMKDNLSDQIGDTKSQVTQYKSMLAQSSQGVKPFKGQMQAIPGLQSPNDRNGGQNGPRKSAIMRAVPMKYSKGFKKGAEIQKSQTKEQQDKSLSEMDERIKKGDANDLLVNLNANFNSLNEKLDSHMKEWSRKNPFGNYYAERERHRRLLQQKMLASTIVPQTQALDAYIAALGKSRRFQNVKGPLYDPVNGWNPGYRVLSSDLRSPIPKTPFEAIHKFPDVYMGQPAEAETTSIGYMPFAWMQDGVKIFVHPIQYELARAKAIREIYRRMMEDAGKPGFWSGNAKGPDMKKYGKYWIEWNKATIGHSVMDYDKPRDVLFKDRFIRFMNEYRKGKINKDNNSIDTANKYMDDKMGISGETWEKMSKVGKTAGILYVAGLAGGPLGIAVAAGTMVGIATAKWALNKGKKIAKDIKRVYSYDKAKIKTKPRKNEKWWQKAARVLKDTTKRVVRGAQTAYIMTQMNSIKLGTISYGLVRKFMFDEGILDLFSTGTIHNTIASALPLLKLFIKHGIIEKGPSATGANEIHDLLCGFFPYAGILGYNWKRVVHDQPAQAAFAQSFLEYIALKILPQWNYVEKLLTNHMTYRTQKTEGRLVKAITALLALFRAKEIFKFMKDNLRFPNMKVRIIDYSNADRKQRDLLDKYRHDAGIPNRSEKNSILAKWIGLWRRIGELSDVELQKSIDTLPSLISKAEFESRFTGDISYYTQLMKIFTGFGDERKKRLDAQTSGQSIVKKPGEVVQEKVLEPPKTIAEIEEERRKREAEEAARKAEEERKAKEERERKLKEEAKRKEELVIAEAKIKAAEAIRKQEQNYETILGKLIEDPGKVTDKDLKSLGDDVNSIKQEAENRIAKLPREERELKLALIRGDKISEKTFTEVKETAVGLHGNLQEYVEEVNKIPVGSAMLVQNTPAPPQDNPVRMQDSDAVDLGDS